MISLTNQVALITGASRGLGRATAELFARAGSHVVINYNADENAALEVKSTCEQFGVQALAIQADVALKADVDRMVAITIDHFGHLDTAVNNAGVWLHNPIDDTTEQRVRHTIDINLMGTFYVCMAVVPHMKQRRSGNIINISSTAGQRGEAFHSPYAATKGAVISLTKSLASELVDFNIRVNCVAPGWFDTDMSAPSLVPGEAEKVLATIPMRRVGRPEELAGPVLFLASDLAAFITGEILNVNGGAVLCG